MTASRQTGPNPPRRPRLRLFLAAALAGIVAVALLVSIERIWHRRWEAGKRVLALVEITEETTDPLIWGRNFPMHLQDYLRSDAIRDGWSGRAASAADSPTWQLLLDGYRPGRHYTGIRGHGYGGSDAAPAETPARAGSGGRCTECHDRAMPDYRGIGRSLGVPDRLYEEQARRGFESLEGVPYGQGLEQPATPVRCIDCHAPETLELRLTRPEFVDAVRALAQSGDPVPHLPSIARWRRGNRALGYRPETMASRQEMRILVCAQCHAGYYFTPDDGTVAFPWRSGTGLESLEEHLDGRSPADWTHRATGARLVKARQPQFELWSRGRHAEQGVSCTDCHMPYRRDGATKLTDHHLRSPRINLGRACGTCHSGGEQDLLNRVQRTQQRTLDLVVRAEDSLMALLDAGERARSAGVPEAELEKIRRWHRKAHLRLDLVLTDGSMGFHAPGETLRILGGAIDFARQGEAAALDSLLTLRDGGERSTSVAMKTPQDAEHG